jgi:hypothetical protein
MTDSPTALAVALPGPSITIFAISDELQITDEVRSNVVLSE